MSNNFVTLRPFDLSKICCRLFEKSSIVAKKYIRCLFSSNIAPESTYIFIFLNLVQYMEHEVKKILPE